MPYSLEKIGKSALAQVRTNDEMRFEKKSKRRLERSQLEVDGLVEFVREKLTVALREGKLPTLKGTPYTSLLTRVAAGKESFDPENLKNADIVGTGFLPIDVNRSRLGTNLRMVAGSLAGEIKADSSVEFHKKKDAAERAIYNGLLLLLDRGSHRAFFRVPFDTTPFMQDKREDHGITAIRAFRSVRKVEDGIKEGVVEQRNATAVLLKELGVVNSVDSKETNELLEDIEEARKLAISFYRELGDSVKKAQIKLSKHPKGKKLKGEIAKNDPYIENSQASVFSLLSRAFDTSHRSSGNHVDQKSLSIRNEAQILAYLTYLILKLKKHPSFEAILYHSQDVLESFVNKFFSNTEKSDVTVNLDRDGDAILNGDTTEPVFQEVKTVRRFKGEKFEGIPEEKRAVYVEDVIREKMLFSILFKVISGEMEVDEVPDMLAGQCALVGLKKEDLYHEEGSDMEKIKEVNHNLAFVDAMAKKAAAAAGCNREVPESDKHYRKLAPGEFQIVKKVHGSKGNEKSHDFSAIKLYMCFTAKNGAVLRMEYRFVPWNTYHMSKSKKSLNSDEAYSLKKVLKFGRYAIRKSQNPRFVEVMEEEERVLKNLEKDQSVA